MTPNLELVKACGQAFLAEFGADCRKRLADIAASIGLEIVEMEAESFDGALLRLTGTHLGTVIINNCIREPGRKLFTLAHEIGHYLLPNQQNLLRPCVADDVERDTGGKNRSAETEANGFAAEILMPRPEISRIVRASPSMNTVRDLEAACDVTLTAAAMRVVELSSYRVALVWSRHGKSIWYKPSEEFGRAIVIGGLDPQSQAAGWFDSGDLPDRMEEVPATAWLYDHNLRQDATVFEHSVALPFYNTVLSLVFIPERIESRDEYQDDDEDPSLDPQEFTLNRKHWGRR